jgi:prepilin-type N-terminal cleavage/methylation domain-containing protein
LEKKLMAPRTNNRGFTLLEVVVSISILALIAIMIGRIFSESTRAVDQGHGKALLDESARYLLGNIEQDIGQALVRTNVPFRVHAVPVGDALYFISTGILRIQSTNPRDTAPLRLGSAQRTASSNGLVPSLNQYVKFEYSTGAPGNDAGSIEKLIRQSDFYAAETAQPPRSDFTTMTDGAGINHGDRPYTEYLEALNGLADHACLTFMDILINGNGNSNYGDTRLPDVADMPRFVDVAIGLVSAKDLQQAMRLNAVQGSGPADDFLNKNEQVYTRRIFLRNTGTTALVFP